MEKNKLDSNYKIKKVIIWVLGIIILLLVVFAGGLNLLFTERFPDEDMQKTLSFLRNDDYIGMTLEECEAVFGKYEGDANSRVICYPAGTFYLGLTDVYEVRIYFDENGLVKEARMQECNER